MYGFVITTAGEGLLARAAAGEGLTLTGVKFGSGAVASAAAAKALTALISEKAAGTSSAPAVSGGQLSLIAEYRNDLGGGLTEGFTLSEFGVFARVGDDAPALLYYAALGDKAQPVQPISEGLDVHRFPVAVGVTDEVAVSLSYPAGAWVTSAQLEESLQEIDLSGYVPTTRKVNGKALSGDITLTSADVGAAAVSHNHSAGDITSGTLSSARLPVVPISKGGTGKTTAAEALAALGGVSAASLAAYDKTIKGAYPIATGNSVTAGDVVDVVDGMVTRNVVAEANVENVFVSSAITANAICRLNASVSLASVNCDNRQIAYLLDNQTGRLISQADFTSPAANISIARLSDSVAVISKMTAGYIYATVVTISGTTFQSLNTVQAAISSYFATVAINELTVVVFYESDYRLSARVLTLVDGSLGGGSGYQIGITCSPQNISATLLPNDSSGNMRVCVCFSDANDNNKGKAVIATINSSNVVTWGSVVTFSNKIESVDVCADGENSVVFYRSTATGTTTSRIKNLSISETVITPSATETETNIAAYPNIENISGKFIVAGSTYDASTSTAYVATKSGNGFVLSSPFVFNAKGASTYLSMAAIDNNHVILAYADNGNSNYGTSTILEVNGNQIVGGFTVNSTQAIALESGEAGQEIEVIFAGTTAADFVTEGQKIPSEGVYGYGPMDGWLNVIPYWAKEAGAKIVMGSYVGTGKKGNLDPNSLTFNFLPKFLMFIINYQTSIFVIYNVTKKFVVASDGQYYCTITYSGNTISWYVNNSTSSNCYASYQLNAANTTYYYLAIG